MQLAVVTPSEETEAVGEPRRRRSWVVFTPHTEKKHRIQDYVRRLERDLAASQKLNETLSETLSTHLAESRAANARLTELIEELSGRVAELEEKLRVANEANVMNANSLSFSFPQRPIDGPEDQATMPVPQVELLADEELKPVAADAATALLDRVVPQARELEPAATRLLPAVAETQPLAVMDEDEPEVYNATSGSWNVHRPVQPRPVTWGRSALPLSQSTTGTFRVTSLHQRGALSPTAFPGAL